MACYLPFPWGVMNRKRVLIVGEDDLIAWAIRKRFSAMQIPVRLVRTAEEAHAALRDGPFDLVVLDPGFLEEKDPAVPWDVQKASVAGRGSRVHGGESAGGADGGVPFAGVLVIEKPLNIFDLDRVVEGMAGRFSEKRGDPRYTCNIPLSIFVQEEDRDGRGLAWGHPTGVAADASEVGLRVFTSHPLVPGQHLQLNPLSVHNPQARLIRRDRVAEVVWVVPDEEGVIAGLRYVD